MPSLALTDFLQDFGRRPGQAAPEPLERRPSPVVFGPPPQEEIDRQVAEAVTKTEEAVTERVSRIYEDTLQAERDHHAAEVDALRATLGAEAGERIAARLGELETQVIALATASAARVLGAFLGVEMQRRTIDRLAVLIHETIGDRDAVRIQVRGPQSLFEPLTAALGSRAAAIDFVETGGFDLGVSIDGSLFETRIAEWSAAIEEAMA